MFMLAHGQPINYNKSYQYDGISISLTQLVRRPLFTSYKPLSDVLSIGREAAPY